MSRKNFLILLVVTLAACTSNTSTADSALLSEKLRKGRSILLDTYKGVIAADSNPAQAITILDAACEQANVFTESLLGPSGWEFPGDIPSKYSESFYATKLACYLSVSISDGAWSDFAMFVSQLDAADACLGQGNC